jgi:hypothetical protein
VADLDLRLMPATIRHLRLTRRHADDTVEIYGTQVVREAEEAADAAASALAAGLHDEGLLPQLRMVDVTYSIRSRGWGMPPEPDERPSAYDGLEKICRRRGIAFTDAYSGE